MTIISVLRERAIATPDNDAFVFVDYDARGAARMAKLTWRQLHSRTTGLAAYLTGLNKRAEQRRSAAISAPPGLDYVVGFLASLCAGWTPVPLPEPQGTVQDKRTGLALLDCAAEIVLTTSEAEQAVRSTLAAYGRSRVEPILAVDALADLYPLTNDDVDIHDCRPPGSSSYLQYTFGSTAAPRGVVLTLNNVERNLEHVLRDYFPEKNGRTALPGSVVSWLPLYHDMGLVLGIFFPLLTGCPCTLISPDSFIRRPARWIRLLASHKAPFSAAPNFAFDLAAARISDADMVGRDLAGVHTIISGAERVQPTTLRNFLNRFRPYGLRPEAVRPSYGLAEAAVFVATTKAGTPPQCVDFDAQSLTRGHAALSNAETERSTRLLRYHNSGDEPLLRIVDPDSRTELGPGEVGEIWVRGRNISRGYHNADETANREQFRAVLRQAHADTPNAPWLRTGDMGFMLEDSLFIVGRIKDLVIQNGANHYPDDIESTVKDFTGGRVAAFSLLDDAGERLVVVAELKVAAAADQSAELDVSTMKKSVMAAVSRSHGLRIADLLLVGPGTIPKTTSGKISRTACMKLYTADRFERIKASP